MGSTGIHQLPSSEPQLLYLACSQIRDPKTRRCLHIIVTFLYLILQPLILTFTRTYDLHPALRHIHPIIYPLFSPKFKAKETSGQPVCWQWTWCWWAWCWWWRCEGERKEKPLPILLTSTSGNRSPWIWVTKAVCKFHESQCKVLKWSWSRQSSTQWYIKGYH